MKSPIAKQTDNRGIPVVSPSRQTHSANALRKKSKSLSHLQHHHDDSVNDQVQLCQVRSTEHYAIPNSPSQRHYMARMYHQSPHRLVSSPGIHSDSFQDVSTEPIVAKAIYKSPIKPPPALHSSPSVVPSVAATALAEVAIPFSPKTSITRQDSLSLQDQVLPSSQKRKLSDLEDNKDKQTEEISRRAKSRLLENTSTPLFSSQRRELPELQQEEESRQMKPSILQITPQPPLKEPEKSTQDPQKQSAVVVSKEDMTVTTNDEAPPDTKPMTKEEEQACIAQEINHLMATTKSLPNYYKLVDKIGEGTFSTVYKALDLRRELYNNEEWEPQLTTGEVKVMSEFVALKRIYHTSSPRRIANEVNILRKLKGSQCISPLITAFRQQDQVFVVMPYIQHDDFKKCFSEMGVDDIRYYLKSLFTALQQLHKHKIVHRDVKPNNFLYHFRRRTGYLIDFGLAESENDIKALEQHVKKQARSLHQPQATHANTGTLADIPATKPSSSNNMSKSALAALSNIEPRTTMSATAVAQAAMAAATIQASEGPPSSSNSLRGRAINSLGGRIPGYIRNDPRQTIRANRAGTRGFRAPEVLMRVVKQTCAIDIWSVGVILLCFLTGRYPFFLANDEADSLVELGQIFGYKELEACAIKHERKFSTNIIIPTNRVPWTKVCESLNKDKIAHWDTEKYQDAISLLDRCLDLDSTKRITAEEALSHPFLRGL
ncbi:kinase-like domain-containing protein [Blakeslea trispora]|nr:kinase-like domain-containing protein [Blakeslea trispora]